MISKRIKNFPYSGIREFFELVQQTEGVVSLGIGEPDFPTPEPIKDAGIRAIENDYTSYTSNYGMLELREKIAEKLKKENNIDYNPESEILITTGVSEALDLAVRAIVNPGEEVIVPEPAYVSYKADVWLAGGNPVPVPTYEENGFRVQAKDIEEKVSEKTKAILIASPNNPTGSVLSKKDLEEIAELAVEKDIFVISDELYEYLIYDDASHHSMASFEGMKDRVLTLNGFSKAYALTGWRLGYAAGSQKVIESMMKIHQYTMLCAPSIAQHAAMDFMEHEPEVKKMVRRYDARRKLLIKGLNELPHITCIQPKGAFYAFPNIQDTGMDSKEFAEELFKSVKVAVVPGSTFGEAGEGYVRCSYSVSRQNISEALERMEDFLKDM